MLRFHPVASASGPCCPSQLPTGTWQILEFLIDVSEFSNMYGTTKIRNRIYCLKIFCPNL